MKYILLAVLLIFATPPLLAEPESPPEAEAPSEAEAAVEAEVPAEAEAPAEIEWLTESESAPQAVQPDSIEQYLISTVANSDLIFVRNGNRHDGGKAASHIQRKYAHFRDQITTPEEFIELCASRSLLTGQPYEVILPDGGRVPLKDWLLQALQQYRSLHQADP